MAEWVSLAIEAINAQLHFQRLKKVPADANIDNEGRNTIYYPIKTTDKESADGKQWYIVNYHPAYKRLPRGTIFEKARSRFIDFPDIFETPIYPRNLQHEDRNVQNFEKFPLPIHHADGAQSNFSNVLPFRNTRRNDTNYSMSDVMYHLKNTHNERNIRGNGQTFFPDTSKSFNQVFQKPNSGMNTTHLTQHTSTTSSNQSTSTSGTSSLSKEDNDKSAKSTNTQPTLKDSLHSSDEDDQSEFHDAHDNSHREEHFSDIILEKGQQHVSIDSTGDVSRKKTNNIGDAESRDELVNTFINPSSFSNSAHKATYGIIQEHVDQIHESIDTQNLPKFWQGTPQSYIAQLIEQQFPNSTDLTDILNRIFNDKHEEIRDYIKSNKDSLILVLLVLTLKKSDQYVLNMTTAHVDSIKRVIEDIVGYLLTEK